MKVKYVLLVVLTAGLIGCGGDQASNENEAQKLLRAARDLEAELADLPAAITQYGEITSQFPGTEAAKIARSRQAMLARAQTLLAGREAVSKDSLEVFYKAVVNVAPDYFAVLKRLGTIYYNQAFLGSQSANAVGFVPMKDSAVEIWEKQRQLWGDYTFRPIPAERHWQDQVAKTALAVTKMLVGNTFKDYDKAHEVIQEGLVFASSIDVISDVKVYAAFCSFRKGKAEDLKQGIVLANEALAYEFLSDNDRARAYHVIGLCYTYIHMDSGDVNDLDEAIRALNEAVNIDGDMADAKQLLKGLRQQRQRLGEA